MLMKAITLKAYRKGFLKGYTNERTIMIKFQMD